MIYRAMLALAACSISPTLSFAQGPWTVTITATMNPQPIGMCAAVWLTILDPKVKDTPRKPDGMRVSMADFDMTVTTPDGNSAVGLYNAASHFSVCGCQGAVAGTVATITATYPGQRVPPAQRVAGVAQQATTTVPLGVAKGASNPQGCKAVASQTVAVAGTLIAAPVTLATPPTATPVNAVPATPSGRMGTPSTTSLPVAIGGSPTGRTPGAIVPLVPVNPSGFTATQTIAGAVQLTWQPVSGVSHYLVSGAGLAPGGQQVLAGTTSLTVNTTLIGTQQWSVGSYYSPGPVSTAVSAFPTATLNVIEPYNPSSVSAKQTGPNQVQISWADTPGVTYYGLFGPGSTNGGVQVPPGTTTFAVSGVPLGAQEWSVGGYYTPARISTSITAFPKAHVMVSDLVLSGWVDLHAHPMINLAFGGKLVHGGVDIGSLLPADASCNKSVRATSMAQALGDDRPSHGGWNLVNFSCGDNFRQLLSSKFQETNGALATGSPANGFPNFDQWPKWNDITHQKMWFEWIRRARDGGLRVMVALATNNKTLGDAFSGPGDGPTDDKASADLQLTEIKSFVGRHNDFMEVALSAADIKRIVQANKIAIVLGVEIDNIGNFNMLPVANMPAAAAQALISSEIQRLYNSGVRYVFPVHVMDNAFGGTAIYKDDFNTANLREAGAYWNIECADVKDDITHIYHSGAEFLRDVGAFVKLGLDPLRHSGPPPVCPGAAQPPGQPAKSFGHRNARGLTSAGIIAVKEMMKRGMIVDIDHMSQKTADATLTLAESFGYPLVSGHSGIRGQPGADAENSRTPVQLERLSKLHGMFGLGSDGAHSYAWARLYQTAMIDMGYMSTDTLKANYEAGAISFGTDLNGLVKGPAPGGGNRVVYNASFPMSSTMTKSWNYNTEGVAHYGMLADFVMDVRTAPSNGYTSAGGFPLGVTGAELVDNHLNRSANYFWQMWMQIEARKGLVH